MDRQEFEDFINIDNIGWREAKSYAKTAPHEYIVKVKLTLENKRLFEKAVKFIRENGCNCTA